MSLLDNFIWREEGALKDLSIALELDDSLLEAYIFRGKCAYLLGDNNLAFHDF